jgi:3-oxoacyl-[acyl-carrier protein] reductase
MTGVDGRYPGLAGKVAVVTGGSRGIGAGIAGTLAAQDVAVAVAGRDEEALDRVVADIREAGGDAYAVLADVTDPEALLALRAETERVFGPVELVAAVAGGQGEPAQITELPVARWRQTIEMNLTSAFLTLKTFLPPMIDRKRGAIVTMASAAGRIATPASPAYGAAKAGLLMLTRQAAAQVAAKGVRINAIAPGAVLNDRISKAPEQVRQDLARAHPLGRIGLPGDIAQTAAFLLSDAASWVTGATVDVNGGRVML